MRRTKNVRFNGNDASLLCLMPGSLVEIDEDRATTGHVSPNIEGRDA